jgi:hypothetical protein
MGAGFAAQFLRPRNNDQKLTQAAAHSLNVHVSEDGTVTNVRYG